jgi:hypothetical protein
VAGSHEHGDEPFGSGAMELVLKSAHSLTHSVALQP